MRIDVPMTAAALIVALGAGAAAGAKGDKDKEKRPTDDQQASYAHFLEVARQTTVDPAAPRWIDGLLGDPRARTVNDLLTVNVVESVNASGSADSSVSKDGAGSATLGSVLGKVPSISNLLDTSSSTKFKGGGSTTRANQLTANLTVRVSEVLPNGNLVLEGAREMQINGDRQLFVLTGVVRPSDIGANNVVLSTAIAELRVQYVGNGTLHDSLSPGFLVRLLNKVF